MDVSDNQTMNTLVVALYPLLNRSRPPHDQLSELRQRGKRADFLDALARLCALQQGCDCAAIALGLSSHAVDLYISATPLPSTLQTQMESWLGILQKSIQEDEADSPTQTAMIDAVYRPSYPKFRALLAERSRDNPRKFLAALKQCREKPPGEVRIETLSEHLQAIIDVLDRVHDPNSEDCERLHRAAMQIHPLLQDESFLMWLEDYVEPYASDTLRKCCLLHVYTSTLLAASRSKRMNSVLKIKLTLHWIGPFLSQPLVVDMSSDNLKARWRNIRTLSSETRVVVVALQRMGLSPSGFDKDRMLYVHQQPVTHCEAALIAYLQARNIEAYPHIGCSRNPCYCCRTYAQAINSHCEPTTISKLSVSKEQDTYLDLPWTMPTTTSQDVRQTFYRSVTETLKRKLVWYEREAIGLGHPIQKFCSDQNSAT